MGKRAPVFIEKEVGQLFLVPLVGMEDVETKVIAIAVNYAAHVVDLLE